MRPRFLLAGTLLILGCGPTQTELEDVIADGTLTFDYTGAGASAPTRFNSSGSMSTSHPEWTTEPGSVAQYTSANNKTTIIGAIPTTGTHWNRIAIMVHGLAVGTTTVGTTTTATLSQCRPDASTNCVGVDFGADRSVSTDFYPAYLCYLVNGSIVITALPENRIVGTFSGTGLCTLPTNEQMPFTITNGAFDVPRLRSGGALPKG